MTGAQDVSDLDGVVESLAAAPVLLVASDYDGTLSPIVDDPEQARPDRESMVALQALAQMPGTHVAVISGRALRDLARLTGAPTEVHLVGSHGSEFDQDFVQNLSTREVELRDRVKAELEEIAGSGHGFTVETKPASVAFHYRNAENGDAAAAVERVLSGPASVEGVYTKHGKMVVELAVVGTDKGRALETIRHRVGASAALFLGDDKTDEDAFGTLAGPDVGVKVGEGESLAKYRVADTHAVAQLLARLAERRAAWLGGSDAVPIEKHAMLSDLRTAAMLTPDARVTWFCAPRLDGSALFAELLGGPVAGYFSVAPVGDEHGRARQEYKGDTMLVRTSWQGLSVTDYLDCSGGRVSQRAGRSDLIRVIEGSGRVRIEFAPRLDFGRTPTRMEIREQGLVLDDTLDPVVLRAPGVAWTLRQEGKHQTAVAEVELGSEPLVLELRFGTGRLDATKASETSRRRETSRFWSDWAEGLTLPSVEPERVRRSALALKALVHGPSGGIAAAATTSLPEHMGGVRNWDYRYCWPRDAALTAQALVHLGSTGEAMRYLDWVLNIVDDLPSPDRVQPVYTVTGHELGSEAEIAELSGYGGSRPVRIGNAASRQIQLDVFGPIADLVLDLLASGAPISSEHWRLVEAMVAAVEEKWAEPDHGIWEVRLQRRHHVHSKVMCWVVVDRGIKIAEQFLGRERPAWHELREKIKSDVLEHGFDEKLGAFTFAYGVAELDAASLWVGLSGMLPPEDARVVRTVEAVNRELRQGPVVYRYVCDDGLPGREGGFHICTGWLIESLAMTGKVDEARSLFKAFTKLIGPTGLLSEQWCPVTERALGNHPQAYSHLAYIQAARRLSDHAAAGRGS
ncbi:MAG: trehalose-phosphatase [Phycisphaerales bacterium]|nr:MAG: trehalose-phosphatase [Phycisphaerales bacterium]